MEKTHTIKKLLDPEFVIPYLEKKIPNLSDLTISPIKRNIGKISYHIVIRYDSASLEDKPIFCSAHAQENRKNAYRALEFINKHGFKKSELHVAKPLFFDDEFKAFFYRGIDGENLLYYIKKQEYDIEPYLKQTAQWIAQMHNIPTDKAENFNPENSRIKTVVPGPDKFLAKIKRLFPQHHGVIQAHFEKLVKKEEENLSKIDRLYLVHGDFHPENVIISKSDDNIAVIDFTDICLSDWARDVGSLLQQIGYMSKGKREEAQTKKHQDIFLKEYFKARNIKTNKDVESRINLYKAWSALRSTIYFLTKVHPEEKNAKTVLEEVNKYIVKI